MKTSIALSSFLLTLGSQQDLAQGFATLRSTKHGTAPLQQTAPWAKPTIQRSSFQISSPAMITQLNMASTGDSKPGTSPYFNIGLIGQSIANQAIIGSTIWTGGAGFQVLSEYAHFDQTGVLLGVAGLLPLVLFSRFVETSESPNVAGLNLSTEMAILRMFGPKTQPILAFLVSAVLGGVTGIVEETTFRGQILPGLAQYASIHLGVGHDAGLLAGAVASTLIFAALHTNPVGFLKGGDAAKDNAVLLGFQLVTGSIFASLYLTTHNLAVPILAHALYDAYTFYVGHLQVSGQMAYAEREVTMPSATFAVEKKWNDDRGEGFVQEARQTFYLMDTNQDGVLSRKELRVALFSYGINLSKMDSEMVAKVADLDENGAIDFAEFLEFIGPVGSTGKAIKNALLGPAQTSVPF